MSKLSKHQSTIKEAALLYHSLKITPIPVGETKRPAIANWRGLKDQPPTREEVEALFSGKVIRPEEEVERTNKTTKDKFKTPAYRIYSNQYTSDSHGLAILTGSASDNLEVIDVDIKNDSTGSLWERLEAAFKAQAPTLFSRLVIAQTRSGGYHLLYKIKDISEATSKLGNQPLAKAENKTVLVETRGEGGYILVAPSSGYKFIVGEPIDIPTITVQEREELLAICRTLDQEKKAEPLSTSTASTGQKTELKKSSTKKKRTSTKWELTSLDDFDQRGDILDLLTARGWSIVKRDIDRIYVKHPHAKSTAEYSGNYSPKHRALIVYSNSTEFTAEKPHSPSEVYTILEAGGDFTRAAIQLTEAGYGRLKNTNEKTTLQVENQTKQEPEPTPPQATEEALFLIDELTSSINILTTSEAPTAPIIEQIKTQQAQSSKPIFIQYTDTGEELASYNYELNSLFIKYGEIQEQKGALEDKDISDLLEEVVTTAARLDPIKADLFTTAFLSVEDIQELGIQKKSLDDTIEAIQENQARENQKQKTRELLTKAGDLYREGKVKEALEQIEKHVKELKGLDRTVEYSKLLNPTSEAEIKKAEALQPDSIDTGYRIQGEELLLNGGAISVFAAPTNHGKTLLLINLVLNAAEKYPEKKFIFFTYEERDTAILQYFVNTYIDLNLNSSKTSNRRLIRDYFRTGSTQFISKENLEYFEQEKNTFFREYIETSRIVVKYVSYNSQELDGAIRYLRKNEPDLGGVFIDYFQLLSLPKEERINSRQEELKQICQDLKNVAVETGLPITLAAQFNREVTNLERLHPTKVGEAGDIERIVNLLVGLWNMRKKPILKGITEAEADSINYKLATRNKSELDLDLLYVEILKARDMPTGGYEFLRINGNTGKVKNADRIEPARDSSEDNLAPF